MLLSELIQLSYEDIAVVQPDETISTTLQTAGFTTVNGLLGSLNAEKYSAFQKVLQTFNLVAGTSGYTLGSGGTFATTGALRAQRVEGWRATNGVFTSGGQALPFGEFDKAAQQAYLGSTGAFTKVQASFLAFVAGATELLAPLFLAPTFTPPTLLLASAAVPMIVGADESFPLINIRVYPTPAAAPGTIELAYWTPFLAFAAVGDTITLPQGWINMLRYGLAVQLYPRHSRVGGLPPELAANFQNAKASIVQQNAPEETA